MHYSQPEIPIMKPIESAHLLTPEYDHQRSRFDIKTAEWTHVSSCRFGEARDSHIGHKWSGDSYRYDIFAKEDRKWVALRWQNGAGEGWLFDSNFAEERGESHLLFMIADNPDENRRWDFCHKLWEAVHKTAIASASSERQMIFDAFCDKRLKKKRIGHCWRMEIVSKKLGAVG